MMHALIHEHMASIGDLCRRHEVRRLKIFGSVEQGGDFDPSRSGADFLVEFGLESDLSPLERHFGRA